jgi:hypothetical protein
MAGKLGGGDGIRFNLGDMEIMPLDVDPSASAGVAAAIGTFGGRSNAGAGELWVKSAAADTAWTLVIQEGDPRLTDDRDPTAHASDHTDGTDDIQSATAGQKGLMTAAYAAKLNGAAELAVAQVWDAGQYDEPSALPPNTPGANQITPSRAAGNEFTYDMASGDAEVQLPPDCAHGYRFTLEVTSDASHALTWAIGYLWGDVTGAATNMAAVGNDKVVCFECRALSATKVQVMPSEIYSP